jgi:Domain of unknown function (DUF4388)
MTGVEGNGAMILHGSIERFDLGSVLQFLAQNAATGILEIRDFEEHGHIYLVKGRLEAISLPLTDDRLGVHLIKSGVLSENQLARVLMEEADPGRAEGRKPLGQRLVEKGFTSEAIIRQVMCRLIMARMFELAHWRNGVFTYDEPEEMPEFQIAIRGDVQELLLRTQVRIDHGERPRKWAAAKQADLCYGCPVTDCSPAIKQKYLRRDLCLWRKMSALPDVRSDPRPDRDPVYASMELRGDPALQGAWVQF